MRYPSMILFVLLAARFSFSFSGVGECDKLLTDFAQLTNKSVYLPKSLSGSCVVQSEKDFPLVLKSAGFSYRNRRGVLLVDPLPPPQEKEKELWVPSVKNYKVQFAFINVSSALDCGLTLNDVLFSFNNLEYSFSIGGSLGCPALDQDGSFSFSVNASLTDSWTYTHGLEQSRAVSEITSATGAVTTQYSYITTGLTLSINQRQDGVFYSLRYTSKNGAVTTSAGRVVEVIQADITESVKTRRKLWIIPLGVETQEMTYRLVLKISEVE